MLDYSAFDAKAFDDVPAPIKFYDSPKLSMTSLGVLNMSSAFQAQSGEKRRFYIQLSRDGRYVLLRPDPNGNICFSRKGIVTHRQMKEMLLARKIQLPVCYLLEWDEGKDAWIGCSSDLPSPPPAEQMLPPQRRRRKKREAT